MNFNALGFGVAWIAFTSKATHDSNAHEYHLALRETREEQGKILEIEKKLPHENAMPLLGLLEIRSSGPTCGSALPPPPPETSSYSVASSLIDSYGLLLQRNRICQSAPVNRSGTLPALCSRLMRKVVCN